MLFNSLSFAIFLSLAVGLCGLTTHTPQGYRGGVRPDSVTAAVGALPQLFCGASFPRVVVTTICCEVVFLPLVWLFVFDANEREFVIAKFRARFPKLQVAISSN